MAVLVEGTNQVLLAGRLSAPAEERVLPSGDQLVTFRLVVDRPTGSAGRLRGSPVDTLDCVAWRGDVRRRALTWRPGDVLEVHGALRRRFWRGERGAVSRTEVEVARARRLSGVVEE